MALAPAPCHPCLVFAFGTDGPRSWSGYPTAPLQQLLATEEDVSDQEREEKMARGRLETAATAGSPVRGESEGPGRQATLKHSEHRGMAAGGTGFALYCPCTVLNVSSALSA